MINFHLAHLYAHSSLRRSLPCVPMYKFVMGAQRSLGCDARGSYYDEVEEEESYGCFDLSSVLIGITFHCT